MKSFRISALLLVVWGVLTFGAVYPWAYWPLAGGCAIVGIRGLRANVESPRWLRSFGTWLGIFALGAVAQLVPLPHGLLLAVSGSTDTFLKEFSISYAMSPESSHALSIWPESTQLGVSLFAAFALFLLGAIRVIPRIHLEMLVQRLLLFAVVLGVFGVVQKAFHGSSGVRLIYGFWQPLEGGDVFGPFVNRNHFAGWMIMALSVGLGYSFGLIDRRAQGRRDWRQWVRWSTTSEASELWLAALAILVMGTALVLTGSRSGIASFVAAVIVATGFVLRSVTRRSRRLLVAAYAGALLVAAIAWGGVDLTAQRFAKAPGDFGARLGAWRDTTRIIRDFPLFGAGLDTYGTAMMIYQTGDRRFMYREAHNDYLQLVAEGGLLLSLPAAIALGLFVREVRRRFREARDDRMTRWIRVGALAGLVGIAAQSLVDFSLQIPGDTVLFVLVAAIAVHQPLGLHRAPGH